MSRRVLLGTLLLAALSPPALAANQITVWYATGTYEVEQGPRTVVITSAGTFKVEATDGAALGEIKSITVAQNVLGTVTLHIAKNGGGDGAQDVGWVDLSNAPTGNIAELRVAETLGEIAGSQVTEASAITGLFYVGLSIKKDVSIGTLAQNGSFEPLNFAADLYITGNGPHAGDIDIGTLGHDHNITITGTMGGSIELDESG